MVTRTRSSEATTHGNKCILVVEDDVTVSDLLAYNLSRAGYDVLQGYDGRTGLEMALSHTVDLVLMDLMLPGLDGMTASREIVRAKPWVPVIIISALREHENMLEGFRVGVDDYVTKPFDLDLLLARVAASLRRVSNADTFHLPAQEETILKVGDVVLDSDARSVRAERGEAPLTPKEHALLKLLLSQPGHLFTREEITEAVWHHRYLSTSRTLDVHMRRLRDKLESVGGEVTIHGVRGVGYRFGPRRVEHAGHA
ncbi:MAG: response regulator transcription factor [Thermoleophilia bacterium]|nr:response regulator transcription factor [Thermoleophilia bacterium]